MIPSWNFPHAHAPLTLASPLLADNAGKQGALVSPETAESWRTTHFTSLGMEPVADTFGKIETIAISLGKQKNANYLNSN